MSFSFYLAAKVITFPVLFLAKYICIHFTCNMQ